MKNKVKKLLASHEFIVAAFVFIVYIAFSVISGNFAKVDNIKLILSQVAINGICAIGVSMVVFLGGIDLSSGSILALCAASSGMFINAGMPLYLTILISMGIGALCGLLNGFLVARFRIPPIIATLASMNVIRGVAIIITGGDWITGFPDSFKVIGQGRVLGLPIPFIIFIVITILSSLMLRYLNIGRKIYAVGGNASAAELAGFNIVGIKLFAYILCGIMIGLAGTVYASMVGTISASTTGGSLGFQVLAAALIGGLSINGGKGTTVGTCFGVILLGIMRNGLILSKVSEYWIDAVTGTVILIALVINALQVIHRQRRISI
ncbi:MAG TPA: ABC transporter permease [Clostridiales bacterium]|nr:ABC transporter permease [Clostridiales bacterium]